MDHSHRLIRTYSQQIAEKISWSLLILRILSLFPAIGSYGINLMLCAFLL
jgi:hypothetical protein